MGICQANQNFQNQKRTNKSIKNSNPSQKIVNKSNKLTKEQVITTLSKFLQQFQQGVFQSVQLLRETGTGGEDQIFLGNKFSEIYAGISIDQSTQENHYLSLVMKIQIGLDALFYTLPYIQSENLSQKNYEIYVRLCKMFTNAGCEIIQIEERFSEIEYIDNHVDYYIANALDSIFFQTQQLRAKQLIIYKQMYGTN